MIATSRLFWIETRRNVGFWAFPFLIGLAWVGWRIAQDEAGHTEITLWPQTSIDIAFAVAFVGPAAGGLAAWVAGRDRRRGLDDLLKTTPAPVTRREFTLLAATTLWVLLAFLAAGVFQGIITAREATWGGPVWPPILIALLAIAAQAAIGYAAGTFASSSLTSRLMTGIVPVVLFVAQIFPTTIRGDDIMLGPTSGTSNYPYENLAPWAVVQDLAGTVFWSPRMDLFWAAAAWIGGLGVLALSIIVLRRRRQSPVAWGTAGAAVLAIAVGLIQLVPAKTFETASPSRAIAYDPVCTQRSIEICVHPAYESALDDTADLVDAVVRPLAGLPGFPVRANQVRPNREGEVFHPLEIGPVTVTSDEFAIMPVDPDENDVVEASYIAIAAVKEQKDWFVDHLTPSQSALAMWLMDQAGWDLDQSDLTWNGETEAIFIPMPDGFSLDEPMTSEEFDAIQEATMAEIAAAADRFGALTPEEQRAWLEANLAALRAGDLSLEDLP